MGGGSWAVIVTESGDCPFVEEPDPLDGAVQPEANVDLELRVVGIDFVSLRASLGGLFVFSQLFFKALDTLSGSRPFLIIVILSGSDCDT